jgi:hypothetical protein
MAKANAQDIEQVTTLLRASLGRFDPTVPLSHSFAEAPNCGPFEWMLTILSIEIDLKVEIPEKLSDNRKLNGADWAAKVAALPKVNSKTYTLDCLSLVAQALLLLETVEIEPAKASPAKKVRAKKSPAKKAPAKKAAARKASSRRG